MAQVRFYNSSSKSTVTVQANYRENLVHDDLLEFSNGQIDKGSVDLICESKTSKNKLIDLISKVKNDEIVIGDSRNGLMVSVGYEEYLLIKRYAIEHANELPTQFEFTENHFPNQPRMGSVS